MQRYFSTQSYEEAMANGFQLVGEDYHHSINVMRMKSGDRVYLAFADQQAIIAEITAVTAEQVQLREVQKELQDKELPVAVTIASGYPKGDKLEWVVQKGTELGAAAFLGFPGKTSVVKWDHKKLGKKQERLEKIAKEAAEQAHRQLQPTVTLLESQNALLAALETYDYVLVAYEESAKEGEAGQLVQTLQQLAAGQSVLVIFGPEGGLTPTEISQFAAAGAKVCALGPRILRTETAPLYFLSAISYQLELIN